MAVEENVSLVQWLLTKFKSTGFAATSKQITHQVVESTLKGGSGHAALVGGAASGGALGNVVMMGAIGVISAVANQMEYQDCRAHLTDFYREELGAKNHKDPNRVGDADLTAAEQTNGTIKQAVGRERSIRNLGIAASFVASVTVMVLLDLAAGDVHGALEIFANPTIQGAMEFGAKVALGGLAYLATKAPLMKIGGKLFGLDKETTHDLIAQITKDREQGHTITREQVVEVMVSGNRQIGEYVRSTFGKEYDELELASKVKVEEQLAKVLPIDTILDNINRRITKASELAYTVQGDMSGVLPKQPDGPQQPGMLQKFTEKCHHMFKAVGGMFTREKAQPIDAINAIEATQRSKRMFETKPESPVVELNNGPGFAERYASTLPETKGSWTERTAQKVVMPEVAQLQ